MVIVYSPRFNASLERILDFISCDSKNRANEFSRNLRKQIESLVFMPFRCRKNAILGDENVRDLIYKGYVIVFRVGDENIEILDIFKQNLPKF